MLKFKSFKFVYINVHTRDLKEYKMSDMLAKTSQQEARMNNIKSTKPASSVETSGALAMNRPASLFTTRVYDMFSSSNPFSVDYSQYSDCGDTVASSGGFLGEFSSAYSTLSSSTGSDCASCSGGSDGGFSGGASSSSCSSGGFSSMC